MFTKTITLDLKDLKSIERVLSALSAATASAKHGERSRSSAEIMRFARLYADLRHQRGDFLHPAMLGEPAFDMLLALYAAADEQPGMSLVRLSELSGVPQSSGLRWIDYLCAKRLIARGPHPTDRRSSIVELTNDGRSTLEALLRAMLDRLSEFTSTLALPART